MPVKNAFDDDEVAAYLDRLPRHLTYSQMAEACERRFGKTRAWSRSKIIRYWEAAHPPGKGTSSRIDKDAELRDFVTDRLGRMTFDELVRACRERFGTAHSPSRSTLHRYSQRLRQG